MTRLTKRSRAKVIHKKNILRFCVAVLGVMGSLIAGEILLRALWADDASHLIPDGNRILAHFITQGAPSQK